MRKVVWAVCLGVSVSSLVSAHDILGMDTDGASFAVTEDVQVYFRIRKTAEHKPCNLNVQFGDGQEVNFKLTTDVVGNDMARVPHRYAQPGKYTIRAIGVSHKNGLYSVPACVLAESIAQVEVTPAGASVKKDSRNAGLENAERKDPRDRYEQALRAREKLFQRQ